MIDTINETTCKNPSCGKPVHQIPGHRHREYCNPTCKQTAYRLRQKGSPSRNVTIVDDGAQLRIAELEAALQTSDQNGALYQGMFTAGVNRIKELEQQVEIQRQRLNQSYQSSTEAQQRITELEQRNAELEHLIERYITTRKGTTQPWKKSLQERWTQLGKAADHPALTIQIHVPAGEREHRLFEMGASNELLEEGNVALRRYLEESNHNQS